MGGGLGATVLESILSHLVRPTRETQGEELTPKCVQDHQNIALSRECPATKESLCESGKKLFVASVADLLSGEVNGVTIGPCLVVFGVDKVERGRAPVRRGESGLFFILRVLDEDSGCSTRKALKLTARAGTANAESSTTFDTIDEGINVSALLYFVVTRPKDAE